MTQSQIRKLPEPKFQDLRAAPPPSPILYTKKMQLALREIEAGSA